MMSKKNKYAFYTLIVLASVYILVNKFYLNKKPVLYPNFGIEIPSGYSTHGIDVSRYQKNIDWELVSQMRDRGQKISFAIAKATEGTNLTDGYFKKNWKAMKEQSILRGAYLYFHPNRSGKAQADYFLSKVNLESGDLPPIIDIEETHGLSNKQIQKSLKECADIFENKFNRKPIIYASVDFYTNKLGDAFNDYPFWGAHYEQCEAPRIDRPWHIWQHNCKGHVNGIDAEVDFNVVNGSLFVLSDLCL